MKQTINFSDFCDAFVRMDRNNNFSYEGKQMLFDSLESYEEDTQTEIELDVIALCCEYNEDTTEEIISNYNIDIKEEATEEEKIEIVRDYLDNNTCLIGQPLDGVFLYQAF